MRGAHGTGGTGTGTSSETQVNGGFTAGSFRLNYLAFLPLPPGFNDGGKSHFLLGVDSVSKAGLAVSGCLELEAAAACMRGGSGGTPE
eukprot:scaffold3461_cov116-Isochrysis_galbana.AAC.9